MKIFLKQEEWYGDILKKMAIEILLHSPLSKEPKVVLEILEPFRMIIVKRVPCKWYFSENRIVRQNYQPYGAFATKKTVGFTRHVHNQVTLYLRNKNIQSFEEGDPIHLQNLNAF